VSRGFLSEVADHWSMLVVGALAHGPARYTRIADAVDGISQRTLTKTLRNLERDGLVSRSAYAESPPRVEYQLTPLGLALLDRVQGFESWLVATMPDILRARTRYDETSVQATPAHGGTADDPR
jgi:DNA-binding HxlR family transcriptional regulator